MRVRDVLDERILITRESARALLKSIHSNGSDFLDVPVVIDFEGVEGIAPSFLDEFLSAFELVDDTKSAKAQLIIKNPPIRLSLKIEAVLRGRGISVTIQSDGDWLLAEKRK